MKMILKPWPHIIIDDFLPQDEFVRLTNHCKRSIERLPERIHYSYNEQVQQWYLNYDPIAHHNMSQYLEFFDHRKYSKLRTLVNYVNIKANFENPVHTEEPFKILSSILYLGPESNNGTEIEWKQNRMLIFAGQGDVTWRDYTSSDTDRYTFNHYLVDPKEIENELYKTLHFRIY